MTDLHTHSTTGISQSEIRPSRSLSGLGKQRGVLANPRWVETHRFCEKNVLFTKAQGFNPTYILKTRHLRYSVVFLLIAIQLPAQIVINEVMSSNATTITDEDGDSSDWLELYNGTPDAINLAGWHITDEVDEPEKWMFPNISIPTGGFLLIFASDKDRTTGPYLHSNFKISSAGEPLQLYNPAGQLVDELAPLLIPTDISYGRQPDGSGDFYFFNISSPDFSNNDNTTTPGNADELIFSHEAAWYDAPIELSLTVSNADAVIYYTLDGSVPDSSDLLYQNPILIQQKNTPNQLSLIPTTQKYWQEPQENVFKINTLRAVAYRDGQASSQVYTRSFLVDANGANRYPVSVISLVTEAEHFFDSTTGIHVPGDLEESGNLQSGNYYERGRDWERPAHLEFFEASGELGIAQDIGVRIHGLFSRQLPQKSIRWYARNEYAESYLEYPFFPEKDIDDYKRLVMRSANPNNFSVPFKDELCHLLVREMGLAYQAFRPVVAFVNGEYWGIFNLKERHDEYYLAENYDQETDEVDMLEGTGGVIAGSYDRFADLMAFARQYDLSDPVNYAQFQTFFDVNNFIDFLVAELYFELWDFPEGNLKFWRPQAMDGQWQWLFNDGDSAMHEYWKSKMLEIVSPRAGQSEDNPLALIFRKLLNNPDFKTQFYQQFLHHLNHTLSPDNVLHKIDSLQAIYDPLMPEHILRWGYPASMQNYHSAVEHLQQFAALRPAVLMTDLEEAFDVPFSISPNPVQNELTVRLFDERINNWSFELYNALGQQILSGQRYNFTETIPFSQLNSGVYFLNVKIDYVWYTVKIVKG